MRTMGRLRVRLPCVAVGSAALMFAACVCAAQIPVTPGVTFVIAVSNAPGQKIANPEENTAQGDYETVVTIAATDKTGIRLSAFIDGVDAKGVRRQVTVPRQVLSEDLMNSHWQVLGFHSSDPLVLSGTTSLGPSQASIRDLLTNGSTAYSFQNYASREKIDGRLAGAEHVKFPVLLNGQRVQLDAIRATAHLKAGDTTRPFEQIILEHPEQPLSLRIAYGPRGASFPFQSDFAREIVRIDFPVKHALDEALTNDCRAEVPGIYFDFNEATLKPTSMRALQDIATTLRKHPEWRISIEGHTDNIGGVPYNDDLSLRRAAAVRNALEHELRLDPANISVKGWGLHRPVENNDTLAGRARNRRVELVRDCSK
jgi:outer membrane protein OmpA-like peptidoglycan-associated protein